MDYKIEKKVSSLISDTVGAGLIWTARRSACGHSADLFVDTSPETLWTLLLHDRHIRAA